MQIEGWTVHPSITIERVCAAAEAQMTTLDNPGFCLACGADADGCEPDACHYECERCGEEAVFGAGELLIYFALADVRGSGQWEAAAQKVPPHTDERPKGRGLNKRKLGTILAALRYWQRQGFTEHPPHPERDIATDGGTIVPLTSHEIDCLCMRLNS